MVGTFFRIQHSLAFFTSSSRYAKGVLGIDPKAARITWTVFLVALVLATAYALRETLARGDWKRSNVQFILQTKVINGVAGQPEVIASYLSR